MRALKNFSICFLIGLMFVVLAQPVMAGKDKVNINTATKQELTVLKYVGEKMADKIIEYRKAQPFQKIEDLMNVKGVGQKAFDANKNKIVVKDK